MAERRYTRSRCQTGDRYFNYDRNQNEDRERYVRKGPLSPLRSPINREKRMSRGNRNRQSANDTSFKVKDNEFPPLGKPEMTPEIGRINCLDRNADWAAQVEKFEELATRENENLKKYRRKLEMGAEGKQKLVLDMEDDPNVLMRRQKTIDYGKNTPGYECYISQIKRNQRKKEHPRTPNKYVKTSRRSWDMQVKLWKRSLHEFDPPSLKRSNSESNGDVSMTDTSSECSGNLEKTFDSDISDASEIVDYRHTQLSENFSHHFPESSTMAPKHSSPNNSLSLVDEEDIDTLVL